MEELVLTGGTISDISPLSGLSNLEILGLGSTQVSDLSPAAKLNALKELYCNSTQIANLSPIRGLTNLEKLNFSSTQVSDLSPIRGLANLQVLSFGPTQVSDLSPIRGLANLQVLSFGSTQVSNLSPLNVLTNLSTLYFSHTQVSDLSPIRFMFQKGIPGLWQTYGEFSSGEPNDFWLSNPVVLFKDCPLSTPPAEIARQGTEAILNWFKQQETQELVKINEAKLLILGEGGVGKTTLTQKIEYGFEHPMPLDSTHGIDIHQYTFECQEGPDFKTNIWDFGGQEIYHATHQFFLTKRSLYILMDDARLEDTRFDYWLQIVSLLSDNSPVLIVQNCKHGRRRDLDESGIREQFKNVIGFYYLDLSRDEEDFDKLRKRIKTELQMLPHTNESWVRGWVEVRKELEALKSNGNRRITFEQYEAICARYNLSEFDTESLGQYLHDLGMVLYFHDDPILCRTVFLDSQWMVNGVYELLDDRSIQDNRGIFHKNEAKKSGKTQSIKRCTTNCFN